MVNSLEFGRTVHAGATTDAALPVIIASLVQSGYKLDSAPHTLPVQLRWGSLALNIAGQVSADFLPIALIPGFWKKSMPARVTVSEIGSDATGIFFRIDSKPLLPAGNFATPHFTKHVDAVVIALQQAGIPSGAWPVTETPRSS